MRGLTLYQPWASLVALGGKQFETRSWGTAYRGPVLIHAAARKPPKIEDTRFVEEAIQVLGIADWGLLPRAAGLAVADLVNVTRLVVHPRAVSERELVFGDYSQGRYAWQFHNVRPFELEIAICGARGLWTVWPELEARVTAALT